MNQLVAKYHRGIEWALGVFVVISSLTVWMGNREPGQEVLTIYDIFPLFGLMAFGLMWTHFVMGALRRYGNVPAVKDSIYKTASFGIVLGLLILHPGLLWLGLYLDGLGPPPFSYINAYSTQLLAVGLGSIGLTIFLAFELHRWFKNRTWWKYVEWAQIVGMAAIFYHAIELGGELQMDWFMAVWWFYGITLALSILYSYLIYRKKEESNG